MRQRVGEFFGENRRGLLTLGVMSMVYALAYFHRIAVPGTIFDRLQSDLAISASAVTMLAAIYLYPYAAMQPFVGMMTDRFGAPRVFLTGAVLISIGSILFPLSRSTASLYASRAVVGIGSSLIYLSCVRAITGLFKPRDFAVLLGPLVFAGAVGGLAGTLPFERLASATGWRPAMLIVSACCVAVTVAVAWLLRGSPLRRQQAGTFTFTALWKAFGTGVNRRLMFSGSVSFAVYLAFQSGFGKKMLTDCLGLRSPVAATVVLITMLVYISICLTGGLISRLAGDRRKPFLYLCTGMTLVACAIIILCLGRSWGKWPVLVACVFLGSAGFGSTLFTALLREVNDPGLTGTVVGVLNGVTYLMVAMITTVAGQIMDWFAPADTVSGGVIRYPPQAYQGIFLVCLVLAVSAFVTVKFLPETRGIGVGDTPERA